MGKGELSHSDIRSILQAAVTAKVGGTNTYVWMRDVYDDYCVYSVENSTTYENVMYRCSYVVNTDNSVTLGDAEQVAERTVYEPIVSMALFAINDQGAADGASIVRTGKIFEIGEYADKKFSLSTEDAAKAIAAFTPCSIDYEHINGPLDGKLGQLRRVWMGSDGKSLMGEVEEPQWLSSVLGDTVRRVSTAWDRATKTIRGLALVTNPRVSDAVLMAAFAGARHNTVDQTHLNTAHDAIVAAGAACMTTEAKMGKDDDLKEGSASVLDWIGKAVSRAMFAQLTPETATGDKTVPSAEDTRVAMLEAEMAVFRTNAWRQAGTVLADGLLRDERILPAERQSVIDAYVTAAEDDNLSPRKVTFAANGEQREGTRVDALVAQYNARPAHLLTREQLPADFEPTKVLMGADNKDTPSDDAEIERLLAATSLGQQILAERQSSTAK